VATTSSASRTRFPLLWRSAKERRRRRGRADRRVSASRLHPASTDDSRGVRTKQEPREHRATNEPPPSWPGGRPVHGLEILANSIRTARICWLMSSRSAALNRALILSRRSGHAKRLADAEALASWTLPTWENCCGRASITCAPISEPIRGHFFEPWRRGGDLMPERIPSFGLLSV